MMDIIEYIETFIGEVTPSQREKLEELQKSRKKLIIIPARQRGIRTPIEQMLAEKIEKEFFNKKD